MDLKKNYGNITVVNEISFNVQEGEIFGFLGPNGAGKTTSIRMIIGEIPKTSGEISILENKIPKDIKAARKIIGVVPDRQNLYDRMTLRQNLTFFAQLYNVENSIVDKLIDEMDLTEHQNKCCIDLSRGLRQRTLIARGLLHNPKVFFLDEPTSALDPHSAKMIRNLVLELRKKGTTVFITTHYMEEADQLCDRIAIIHRGKIVACDSPETLKKNLAERSVFIDYIQDGQTQVKEFSLESSQAKNEIAQIVQNCEIIRIRTKEASLEDVFMHLTGDTWNNEDDKS